MNFKHFNHLNIPEYWERYFTKYPQGMTILESLFEWVSQVDSMVDNQNTLNDVVNNYGIRLDEFISKFDDELEKTVIETLGEWQESGFLDVVISEAIQWELDTFKIETNQNFEETNNHIAQVADIFVSDFKLDNEEVWDSAIVRAIESVEQTKPIRLTFPKNKVTLGNVVTRRHNLTVSAYDTEFVATNPSDFMWTHYGDHVVFEGFTATAPTNAYYKGLKIANDETTPLSSYALIRDVKIHEFYQGLHLDMLSGIGGASYRHVLSNIRVQKWADRQVLGSFGIKLSGTNNGDTAGNDTKINQVFVKGYEKNIISQGSTGLKLFQCGIDGGKIAIEVDGGSHLTIVQSYIEYNNTVFNLVNNPYRIMVVGTTYANYDAVQVGTLHNNEGIIEYSTSTPNIRTMPLTYKGIFSRNLTRTGLGHGAGFWIDNMQSSLDYTYIGDNVGLVPTESRDMYYSTPGDKKLYFGDISGTRFTTIDQNGVLVPDTLIGDSMVGTVKTLDSVARPYVSKSRLFTTNNTIATIYTEFRGGMVGQEIFIKVSDDNTILRKTDSINAKNTGDYPLTNGRIYHFICFEAGVFTEV